MSELRTSTARKAGNTSSALTAAKSNVVQQAKLMDSAGTAWHAVKYGNLEMITRLFPSQCNVYSKGPVGENVFHIAMLCNTPSTLAIAKYLVKLYGSTLVCTPYQERKSEHDPPGQYEGETALHIAIVNRDFDMVKFLVQNGADVRARAYGSFFQPGSAVYYGEYPLSFAACTGQKDIVSYLKRHGARVNSDVDMHGNTALHMCVYHDQPDMYDHLIEYCGASEHVQNNNSQTPMLLAASIGKIDMLQHVYNKRRKVAWAYGPVTSYSLSLREIDTVQNVGEFVPSVIETIVRKGHLEALGDPLVQTLLHNKWARFAMVTFLTQVSGYLVWVVSQTFLVWMHCDQELWNSRARMALEIIGVVLSIIFLAIEFLDFVNWTIGVYRRRRLTKAASKYRPPLYPIPGEKTDNVERRNTGFLSRFMKSDKDRQQGVAEGLEHGATTTSCDDSVSGGPGDADRDSAASSRALRHNQQPYHQPQQRRQHPHASVCVTVAGIDPPPMQQQAPTAAAQPMLTLHPTMAAAGEVTDWQASCREGLEAASGSAGPVAEGTDNGGPSTGTPFGAMEQQAMHTHQLAGLAAADSGMARMQQLYLQLQQARASGNAGNMAALQHQLSALQQLRSAGGGQAAGTLPAMSGSLGGSFEPVDIVSVGLSPLMGPAGSGAFLQPGGSYKPPTTSMLMHPTHPAHVDGGGTASVAGGRERHTGGPSGLARVPSLGGSIGEGEIKNRMRGGGGGDMARDGTTGVKRMETRRNVTGSGAQQETQQEAEAREEEEQHADNRPLVLRHARTLFHAYKGYAKRMLWDPIQFVHLFHVCATLVHFITWASTYGGVDGDGPSNVRVAEFDDVVVSLMALSGWASVLYYSRGFQATGQLMVVVERCMWEMLKFACIFFLADIGFTLAFIAVTRGTTFVMEAPDSSEENGGTAELMEELDPWANIGLGMMQLVRFMYGEALYRPLATSPGHLVQTAFGTIYFLLYVGFVLLLLCNVLIAMVVQCYTQGWGLAEKQWRLRWAQYVLRVEARMPLWLQQRFRLGEVSYDPVQQTRVYNHVFEVMEEAHKDEEREQQAKALEAALDKLRGGTSSKSGGPKKLGHM